MKGIESLGIDGVQYINETKDQLINYYFNLAHPAVDNELTFLHNMRLELITNSLTVLSEVYSSFDEINMFFLKIGIDVLSEVDVMNQPYE